MIHLELLSEPSEDTLPKFYEADVVDISMQFTTLGELINFMYAFNGSQPPGSDDLSTNTIFSILREDLSVDGSCTKVGFCSIPYAQYCLAKNVVEGINNYYSSSRLC